MTEKPRRFKKGDVVLWWGGWGPWRVVSVRKGLVKIVSSLGGAGFEGLADPDELTLVEVPDA